ncbi:MAG: cytochrome c [Nitrospirota bacterium]|jgi:cytochrome c oxidase cbb3-type subunit 3
MEMIKRITFTILTALFVTIFIGINQAFAVNAEENYKWYCSQCHGLTGKGDGINATKDQPVNPRNHTDTKEMAKLSASDVENVIRDGGAATSKSTMMPPFGKTMTDAEIKELVAYLSKLCNCKFK